MQTIVIVLETMRDACRKQRDRLIKQVDDCTLPLNRESIKYTTAIEQRAITLNDFLIVLTDTINELKTALETEKKINTARTPASALGNELKKGEEWR